MRVLEVKGNTEADNEVSGKWKGYITASIAVPLDRTWQIGSDFSGLHKFVPIVEICERLKGCNRSPGCLRFYTMNSATGLPGGKRKAWAKDRLLNIDEETHSFTYAVEGSNMNLENCEVSFKASSDGKDGTTIVKWDWEVDPVKKSTKEKTLNDMSEFGCNFIKGLEAAAATTDSIEFDFEGAPLDTLTSDGGGGFASHHPPVPVLSLMKSRLDTLTESLSKISQTLEEGPIPADLYQTELESLQSTIAEGRRSLISHLHGYMSDNKSIGQSNKSIGNSNTNAERYEHYCISSSETISPRADASTSKTDSEACCRNKPVDALILPHRCLPDKGKAKTPDWECQAASLAKFPKLPSAEELRVIMEAASRGAFDAFQDFSNQFHCDLRDDISHQLESLEAQLQAVGFQMQEALGAGVKEGLSTICPNAESQGEDSGLGAAGPVKAGGQNSVQILMLERYPDDHKRPPSPQSPPSPPSQETNLTLSPRSQTPEINRGQYGVWELDRLRSQRSQGSPQSIYSVRFKSRLLFRDLLQEEMSRDSDPRSSEESEVSPRTFEFRRSFQEMRVSEGGSRPGHQDTHRLWGQRSPSPHSPGIRDVPTEFHSQPQDSDHSGRFRNGPPRHDKHIQHLNDMEPGEHYYIPNPKSEIRRRTSEPEGQKDSRFGQMPDDSTDDSSQKFASAESSEGIQRLQDNSPPQGWKHRGFKMRQTAQNLGADRKGLQITEDNSLQEGSPSEPGESSEGFQQQLQDSAKCWKHRVSRMRRTAQNLEADLKSLHTSERKLQDGDPRESGDGEFYGSSNASPRPNTLLSDIWPKFPQGESDLDRNPKKVQGQQDSGRGACTGHHLEIFEFRREEVHSSPRTQKTRDIPPEPNSPTSSPSPCQSSKTFKKILHLKSHSPRCSPSRRELVPPQIVVGGTSISSSPISKRGSDGAKSCSPDSGSYPSRSPDQPSGSPLSAGNSSLGQKCSKSHVILDLKHEIAPGVFHCRQGNQTRVVINIPEHLEARNESRRHPLPLLRKDEIYKEFKLLGIQKPPTEEQLLEDFAATRYKKQQEASIFEKEKPSKSVFPVYQPYYADGKVWDPVAGPSPTVDKSRIGHLTETNSPIGQSAGHSSDIQALSCKRATSQRRSTTARIIERRPQSEQQSDVTNSCQGDESHTTSDGLRGETTAGELAAYDNKTQSSGGGEFKGHQGSSRGSTSRRGSPMQTREILMKGHGRRIPHVQPSNNSESKAKTKVGASSLTERSSHSLVTSSGDNTFREHTSMGSGDSFPQEEERLDENSSSFSTSPVILKKLQAKWLKINYASLATCPNDESRQPEEEVSPRSSLDSSLDNILSQLSQHSEENHQLDIITNKRDNLQKTSREHSLDEVVHNLPSDSGSSDFDPFRSSGKLGSIAGSTTPVLDIVSDIS